MSNTRAGRWINSVVLSVVAAASGSCGLDALKNLTSANTTFQAGSGAPTPRAVTVAFINNTPFRAIFTCGTYDQLDKDSLPTNFLQFRLEANTSSAQFNQPCRKTLSLGGAELIRRIEENQNDPSLNITDPLALIDGVNFSNAPLGDPLEAAPTEGTAQGIDLLSGVDFTCNRTNILDTTGSGLVIFTFEQDAAAPGGFRVDFQFVAP